MKSIEKNMLILVASLALLLAGCGGGSSTAPPADVPSAAQIAIDEAKAELMDAEAAVSSAMTDMEMAAAYRAIENAANALVAALTAHGGTATEIAAAARTGGNAKAMADSLDMKIADAQAAADKAMAATAAKLYAGIGSVLFLANTDVPRGRHAYYSAPNDANITVEINDAGTTVPAVLTEDKKAMVADYHGWAGKRYTASGTGLPGTYEAIVYSNAEPTPGAKFSTQYSTFDPVTGVLPEAATEGTASRVASPRFDQSAGVKTFELPTNNVAVMIPGSFHGVAGQYSCVPGAAGNTCAVRMAAEGFTLGTVSDADNNPATPLAFAAAGGTWTFKPGNPDALVTSTPDPFYASYGWWIHTAEDGKLTVGALIDEKGGIANVPDATRLADLHGTATYIGGAVGNYALSSSTGGTNDAGHFTADATLEADFTNNSITGTLDNFMGADGMSRDWSVEMMKQTVATNGGFNGTDGVGGGGASKTKWTIDGTAGSASGLWRGKFKEPRDDLVPTVGIGTFHSSFGVDGRMVGAFGVNLEE